MNARAEPCGAQEILEYRQNYRNEMNCQIVHDSIHRRAGWTLTYRLEMGGITSGFGSVATGGPWKDKPTLFEFYDLGAVPGARCNPTNVASRQTLQRAGFVPFANMLTGTIGCVASHE